MKISLPREQKEGSPMRTLGVGDWSRSDILNNIVSSTTYSNSFRGSHELESSHAVKSELQGIFNDEMSDSSCNLSRSLLAEVWEPGPRSFCGEPMVIPKPTSKGEDDAWIIVGVHDASTCKADILVFDAAR
jgi:hypothetical protein